ncbi:MAG: hypothetical protein J5565_01030 [Muribaculaceae bacterium]|nr:hypothetical protein [Muribaculaceae bacterium]
MNKIFGTNQRHDGIRQTGRRRWTVYYGFGIEDGADYGWDYRHEFDHLPAIDEVRSVIFDQINADTHDTILQGMTWRGHLVWLSDENQRNYTLWALAAERNGTMPTVKLGTDEEPYLYTFADIDEVREFIGAVAAHIDGAINANRRAKAEIDWQVFNPEYLLQ